MTDENTINILRLIRSENIGPKTFYSLLCLHKNAEKALEALPAMSKKGGRDKPLKICSKSDAIKEIEFAAKKGAKIITYKDACYPRILSQISDSPPVLTVYGNADILNNNMVAIVGARNASANGCRFAEHIATELGLSGIVSASGLARGIDTAAHKGSLDTGTIAVVAGGIDKIYPPENKDLFKAIGEKGAVIAEMPFGAVPKAQNFPRRNRIISGISLGTIVVEASMNSGSLITARMTLEQNREVFAVPGSPLDPRCKGTNKLIKDGAHLVESAEDVLAHIDYMRGARDQAMFDKEQQFNSPSTSYMSDKEVDKHRNLIIQKIGTSPTAIDDIIAQTDIAANIVLTVILELELAGRLDRHFGNKVSLSYVEEVLPEEAF